MLYSVIAKRGHSNWKNVTPELEEVDFGNGAPDTYLFKEKWEAEELLKEFKEANTTDLMLGFVEVEIEEIEEE